MHAKHPQLLEHRQQEERIAHQRMRLKQAGLFRRELLAEPAEILADELRLLGRRERLDDELLPGEPQARCFEHLAVEARRHEAHAGGQHGGEPPQVPPVGELVEPIEHDQDGAAGPPGPGACRCQPRGEFVELLVRIALRLELLAHEPGDLLHETHGQPDRISRVGAAPEVVNDHRRVGVHLRPSSQPVGDEGALAAAGPAPHEQRPRRFGREFRVERLEVSLAAEIEPPAGSAVGLVATAFERERIGDVGLRVRRVDQIPEILANLFGECLRV